MADFDIVGSFKINEIDTSLLSKMALESANYMAAQIEGLCEQARRMGDDVCLVVAPMQKNERTFGFEVPYRFQYAGEPVAYGSHVYGPWPANSSHEIAD